ncbi:hypothetical protein Dsin_016571 [Dipteronia sinensis]|uniref:Uncharacterized protein n=1 Tax=Dipteronia sinensis TaxID=43782 RepID=A0AAE0E645_9ROSI|nr:hypothetical protein Dsin_016571 [Dipteronia sinensis]
MMDFGEELTIDTLKIPCLIWIQILVLLLLLILLYCFSRLSLDLSHNTISSSSAAPSSSSSSSGPSLLIKRSSQPSQTGGSQIIKGEISTGTIIRRRVEVLTERESASASASSTRSSSINHHPCHYFKLARLALLKCLGLDSESQNSSNPHEQRKE